MQAHTAKRFGALSALIVLLGAGTACGANPLVKDNHATPAGASPAVTQEAANPEMQAAEDRVQKAESQLDLARKQLSAAKSLLKAAEADLKAAKADRDSVGLRYQAQDLAEQAGLPVQSGRAVAQPHVQLADRGNVHPNTSIVQTSAPTPVATPQSVDYNAIPQTENDPPVAPNLQLR